MCTHMPTVDTRWWSSFKTIGSVSVVHVDLSAGRQAECEATAWLDEQERARQQRIEHKGARRRFSLTRAALRSNLCEKLECRNEQLSFRPHQHGKPYALVEGRVVATSFNVSHSGDHGLLAFASEGLLGVDVEMRDGNRDISYLVDTVLSADEQARLSLVQGHARMLLFYKLWTIKEAALKALGDGLARDATSVKIPTAMLRGSKSGTLCVSGLSGVPLHIRDLGNQDFAAAVAYAAGADQG